MAIDITVDHAVATLTDGTQLRTPFWRIDSDRDGHHLAMLAAQHGNEVQGIEVARRFADLCAEQLVAGTVTLVPYANLLAIRHRRHSSDLGPEQPGRDSQGFNMQQAWPGDPDGNDIERVVYALDAKVIAHCDRLVDMHCWNHFWAAAVLARSDNGVAVQMAEATDLPFVMWRNSPEPEADIATSSHLMYSRGGVSMAIELSGQYQMREAEVDRGLRAMTNVAKVLDMIPGEPEIIDGPMLEPLAGNDVVVEAPCSGIFMHSGLEPGQRVVQGLKLGHIVRDDDLETVVVRSPACGRLWKYGRHDMKCDVRLPDQHPYASEGDMLALIVQACGPERE